MVCRYHNGNQKTQIKDMQILEGHKGDNKTNNDLQNTLFTKLKI